MVVMAKKLNKRMSNDLKIGSLVFVISFFFCIAFNVKIAVANGDYGNVYIEPSVTLIDQDIKVSPASYMTYTLDNISPGLKLGIKIDVSGGMNNDIFVYLLDFENYSRYINKQRFLTFIQNPTIVYQNTYEFRLPKSGPYYLVLDNTNSIISSKYVRVYVTNLLNQPLPYHVELQKVHEKLYKALKDVFEFPSFDIYIKHCGQENAFSDPNITICIEKIDGLYKRGNLASVTWILFHELGHSLLRLWDYPLWDNEDAADEFATVFLLLGGGDERRLILRQAVSEWISQPSEQEAKDILKRGDRHSISIQRARNILNWEKNADELKRRWFKIFVPHIKTYVLQQMKTKPEPWMDISLIENELKKR